MYSFLTENFKLNPIRPLNENAVIYSLFREFSCKVPFNYFSIKYVMEGLETYNVNGHKFHVVGGQYLLANNFAEGTVHIESKKMVRGICINLSNDIISEVVASSLRPDTCMPDCSLEKYFTTPDFLENQYSINDTKMGSFLAQLDAILSKNPFHEHQLAHDFYFGLAEHLVSDQSAICRQMLAIPSIKTITRKDLTRKVMLGKNYIDSNFKAPLSIEEIARECGLSEYHFHRLFKMVYTISPYQYLLNKRLSYSLEMLKKGNDSLTDIAYEIGFADIYSFSKAFKKHYGAPPSAFSRDTDLKKPSLQNDFIHQVATESIRQVSQ
ncbi:MAG: helix-turn-helix transcriptional regulator [Saprospiraceae bacterium]|nr:helix-turn-helix transcriptional regulator [Saprospiraceae bacterium]